jgi:hypothetical protein
MIDFLQDSLRVEVAYEQTSFVEFNLPVKYLNLSYLLRCPVLLVRSP